MNSSLRDIFSSQSDLIRRLAAPLRQKLNYPSNNLPEYESYQRLTQTTGNDTRRAVEDGEYGKDGLTTALEHVQISHPRIPHQELG